MNQRDVDGLLARTRVDQWDYEEAERKKLYTLIFRWFIIIVSPVMLALLWFHGGNYIRSLQWKPYVHAKESMGVFVFSTGYYGEDLRIEMQNWRMVRKRTEPGVYRFDYSFALIKSADVNINRLVYFIDFKRKSGRPTGNRFAFRRLLTTSHFTCIRPHRQSGRPLPLLGDKNQYKPAHLIRDNYQVEAADDLAQYFPWGLNAAEVDARLMARLIHHGSTHPDITMRAPVIHDNELEALRKALAGRKQEVATARARRDAALDMRLKDAALEHEAALRKAESEVAGLEVRLTALTRRQPSEAPSEMVNALAIAWQRNDIHGCQRILQQLVGYVDCRVLGPPELDSTGEMVSQVSYDIYLRTEGGGICTTCSCCTYSSEPVKPRKQKPRPEPG